MTAPPTAPTPVVTFSGAAPYIPSGSTATNSEFSWTSTTSAQGLNCSQSQRPMISPTLERNAPSTRSNGGLLFITGTSPADFKSRQNMTRIRKKAMGSYLKRGKMPNGQRSVQRSRETSTGPRTSIGSDQQDLISNSEALRLWNGDYGKDRRRNASLSDKSNRPGTAASEMQVSRLPTLSMDSVLSNAPIVLPMRTGIKLAYDETVPGPFESIGKPLDPFRTMFQASHPQVSVEELKFHCSRSFGTRAMGLDWIPTIVQSPHAFLSTLCISSAHYDAVNERALESVQTLALRQEVMHLINRSLVNPQTRVDDYNVISLTQLALSEIISGEEAALKFHEAGVEAMIKQRGGIEQLGMNGKLASAIAWVGLESAILRENKAHPIYTAHCTSATPKHYPNTATIPESPIYCPQDEYETLRRSQYCLSQTLDLLKDMRMMMDLFLHETKKSWQNSLSLKNIYKKITTHHRSVAELPKTHVLTSKDWRYEAIRLTCVIMATAIKLRIPLSEALEHAAAVEGVAPLSTSDLAGSDVSPTELRNDSPITSSSTSPLYPPSTVPSFDTTNPFAFVPSSATSSTKSFFPAPRAPATSPQAMLLARLKLALQNSDLSECWADMGGVLFWVGLTLGAASRQSEKVLKKWFRALVVRVSIILCFEHPEAIQAGLVRMAQVIEGFDATQDPSRSSGLRVEKRRKV